METQLKRRSSRIVLATLVALLGVIAAGCGVSTQSEPETVDRETVPFDLLSRQPRPDEAASAPGLHSYVVYLARSNSLVPTIRSQTRPPTQAEVLHSLVRGATEAESEAGLRTDIPAGSKVSRVDAHGAVATVELGGSFDRVRGQARIVAFAQIVFTATESLPVSRVRFELDGRPIDVPTGDGTLTGEPVGRTDYAGIVPSPASDGR